MPRPIVRNSGPFGSLGEPAAVDIGVQVGLKIVVAGHFVALAALLVQPHPQAAVLHVNVLDLHRERRADAREGIDHEADQGAVAQARPASSRRCCRASARASAGSSTGVLPRFTLCDGPRTDDGRIHRHDLARHKPVEQMPDRGEALLDGRRGSLAAKLLDVGGDVQRLHVGDRRDAGALAPGQEFPRRLRVGAARVRVADVGGEEFEEARRRAGRTAATRAGLRGGSEGSEMVHVVGAAALRSSMMRKRWVASMIISAASFGSSCCFVP